MEGIEIAVNTHANMRPLGPGDIAKVRLNVKLFASAEVSCCDMRLD